ncbi:LytTR family DNA-binding domain-containing protein [Sporofaciens musculi]|uniref:LytTR family DNA-binding domain-containing protein n=1 Tax=Sporofaciens musculi TaxID=2681861 RepID=UPI0025700644|nr:LytTR family DNA-binding domain-containing protein [Sporofaciens musculi]
MDWIQELIQKESLCCSLTAFLDQHGFPGLEKALQLYSNTQTEYIYKTKAAIIRIKIGDIYFMKIQTHNITIHTEHGIYQKYGSLTDEQKFLTPYGFIRCRQNCLVSLEKIHSIYDNTIILTNNLQLRMSQRYAPKLLASFACTRILR